MLCGVDLWQCLKNVLLGVATEIRHSIILGVSLMNEPRKRKGKIMKRARELLSRYDFESEREAEEWAHRESLIYDTDEECQAECERLLRTVIVRDRRKETGK